MFLFATQMFWWDPLKLGLTRVLPHVPPVVVAVILGSGTYAWGLVGIVVIIFLMLPRRATKRIAAWRTSLGYCGACATPLKGLQAADDGCVVCPKCGAAWRPQSRGAAIK